MRRGRAVIIGLLAVALVGLFVVPLPGLTGPLWREVENAAHVAVFAALAILLRAKLGRDVPAFVIAAGAGLVVELLQAVGPRDASWRDLANDAAGAFAGILLHGAGRLAARSLIAQATGMLLAAAAVTVAACWPLAVQAAALAEARRAWPVLLAPSMTQARRMISARFSTVDQRPDGLRVHFRHDPWPGVTREGWLGDWSEYRVWILDIENLSDRAVDIGLAVRDGQDTNEYRNRFNASRRFAPRERREVRLPLSHVALTPGGRRLDLGDIRSFSIFRTGGDASDVLIREVRLQ